MAKHIVNDEASNAALPVIVPTQDDVARRAYELYQTRNGDAGTDLDDWLQAERELRSTPGPGPGGIDTI